MPAAPTPLNADQAKDIIIGAIQDLKGRPATLMERMELKVLLDHLYAKKSLVVVHWPR